MLWKSGMEFVYGEGVTFEELDVSVLYALTMVRRVADKRCDVAVISIGSDRENVVLELLEVTMAEIEEGLRKDPTMWLRDFPEGFELKHAAVYRLSDIEYLAERTDALLSDVLVNWIEEIERVMVTSVSIN